MRPKLIDLICLGGSLAIAIVYRSYTGDAEMADRVGMAFMMSWVALQTFRYLQQRTEPESQ